jgi:hypothetical protein
MGLFTLANARKKEPWNENWTQTDGFNQSTTSQSAEPLTTTESVEPTEELNTNTDPKQN